MELNTYTTVRRALGINLSDEILKEVQSQLNIFITPMGVLGNLDLLYIENPVFFNYLRTIAQPTLALQENDLTLGEYLDSLKTDEFDAVKKDLKSVHNIDPDEYCYFINWLDDLGIDYELYESENLENEPTLAVDCNIDYLEYLTRTFLEQDKETRIVGLYHLGDFLPNYMDVDYKELLSFVIDRFMLPLDYGFEPLPQYTLFPNSEVMSEVVDEYLTLTEPVDVRTGQRLVKTTFKLTDDGMIIFKD